MKLPTNLRQLGDGVFTGYKSLTEITIPDLVDNVGNFVFFDCNQLREIHLGNHIQQMGANCFLKIAANAVISGPANSLVQTYANDAGLSFQVSGNLCALVYPDEQWKHNSTQHFHTCEHGARFDYSEHIWPKDSVQICTICKLSRDAGYTPNINWNADSSGLEAVAVLCVIIVPVLFFILRKKK